jgi:hypothetical protein
MSTNNNTPMKEQLRATVRGLVAPDSPKKPRNNRRAGHQYECDCVRDLKAIGFDHVVTSRSESKTRDNLKVDIMNREEGVHGRLPYNIQCKTTAGTLGYSRLLAEMPRETTGVKNVLFHKQTEAKGGQFRPVGEYAVLTKKAFLAMAGELRVFGLQHEALVRENNALRKELAALQDRFRTPEPVAAVKADSLNPRYVNHQPNKEDRIT